MRKSWMNGMATALCGATLAYPGALSLDSLIRMGLAGNADLRAAEAQLEGLAQDTLAAAYRANPALSVEALGDPSSPSKPKASVRVSREFRFGYAGKSTAQAKSRIAAAGQAGKGRGLDLEEAIRNEYQAWQILDRKAALQAEAETRWQALARLAAAKVAEGKVSQVDETQARLNHAKAKRRRMEILAAMAATEGRLGYLVGTFPLPGSLGPDFSEALPSWPALDTLEAWALASNPDVLASGEEIAAAERQLALEEALRNPPLTLSLGYEREADGADLFGGGVELPIPLFNRNQAGLAKARAGKREAEWKREAVIRKTRAELSASAAELQSLADRYRAYQSEVRDLSRKQTALSEKGFREGLLGVFELSRVEEEALDQDLEALDILDAFNRTWNRLARLVGGKTWK